jgi:hypothetical protein
MHAARRFGRTLTRSTLIATAAMVLPWTMAANLEVAAEEREERRRRQAGLAGVVGHWSAVTDEGPALQADGTKWSGTTDPGSAKTSGQALFGSASSLFVSNVTAAGAFPLAVWRDAPDFTGGTLRVRFKLVAGATDQTAGIVFGLQPDGTYHYLRYNTRDGDLAVWRYRDGQREIVVHGTSKAQLPLKAWHQLTVTIAGAQVTGSLKADQLLTVEHTLDKPVTGRVGLWTKRDSVTTFKEFSVGK